MFGAARAYQQFLDPCSGVIFLPLSAAHVTVDVLLYKEPFQNHWQETITRGIVSAC